VPPILNPGIGCHFGISVQGAESMEGNVICDKKTLTEFSRNVSTVL